MHVVFNIEVKGVRYMNRRNIIIGCVVVALIILGIILNNNNDEAVNNVGEPDKISIANHQIVVDIKGEVKNPGIYCLNSDSRVIDAINIAGGLTYMADTVNINLAIKLEDGMIVNIFRKESLAQVEKISINRASINELMKLEGIGEIKAKSIIEYRNAFGHFMSLEDLCKVNGITKDIYNKNKEFICL